MRTLMVSMALAMCMTGCEEQTATPTPEPTPATTQTSPAPETTAEGTEEVAEAEPNAAPNAAPSVSAEAKDQPAQPKAGGAKPTAKTDTPEPAETAKSDEAEPTLGDKKSEPQYAAWLQSSGKYSVGKGGSVQAVLIAKDGWKCNDAYPYKFKVGSAPEGVSFASDTARGASVGKERTTLSVPFTATSAGAKTISGKFFFSVCNESTCKIQKQDLSVTVNVE